MMSVDNPKNPEVERGVFLVGNSNLGTLVHMHQIHWRNENPRELNVIAGKSQAHLLLKLSRMEIKHLFVEGLHSSFDVERYAERIRKEFLDDLPHDPYSIEEYTEAQFFCLAFIGAPFLHYALNSSNTVLHNATTPEWTKEMTNQLEREGDTDETKKMYMDGQERLLMDLVQDFLKKSPGEKIAIFLGQNHNLVPHIISRYGSDPKSHPRLEGVTNDFLTREFKAEEDKKKLVKLLITNDFLTGKPEKNLIQKKRYEISFVLHSTPTDIEKEKIIRNADTLPETVLNNVKTESLQLLAIPKIDFPSAIQTFGTKEALEKYLLKLAVSEKVLLMIGDCLKKF
ncbi:hypothetical protein IPN35_06620 [Candidatus Peregrinibacteria bacterium]|nr:MAG: hypothetical protein IPN35_06620 [Candidatus Peregrinibacteria bacterium]